MGILDKKLDYGEVEVDICDRKFILKGNFRGLREMENRACTGMSGLLYRFGNRCYGINDITSIVYGGIIGKIRPKETPLITFEELGELIIKHGYENLVEVCTNLISFAHTGIMPEDIGISKKKALKD